MLVNLHLLFVGKKHALFAPFLEVPFFVLNDFACKDGWYTANLLYGHFKCGEAINVLPKVHLKVLYEPSFYVSL